MRKKLACLLCSMAILGTASSGTAATATTATAARRKAVRKKVARKAAVPPRSWNSGFHLATRLSGVVPVGDFRNSASFGFGLDQAIGYEFSPGPVVIAPRVLLGASFYLPKDIAGVSVLSVQASFLAGAMVGFRAGIDSCGSRKPRT